MKNEPQTLTEELVKREPPITANALLEEIKPILDDYFIGEICFQNNGIAYRLPNGQTFCIKAEAIS